VPQRRPTIGGNWKMNLHRQEALDLSKALAEHASTDGVDVAIFPAFPYLATVSETLCAGGSNVMLGAQDVYPQANGAFTGEVSCSMLTDVGCKVVLVGHSERRHVLGESDTLLNDKTLAALEAGLGVVFCVGETLDQREANKTDAVNAGQLGYGLAGVTAEQMQKVTIAYEPVWAIGTGKTATPEDAQSAHAAIRNVLKMLFNDAVADATRIQYGGSVKPANAADLFARPDIDGGLIGGASLKSDDFLAIIDAARP